MRHPLERETLAGDGAYLAVPLASRRVLPGRLLDFKLVLNPGAVFGIDVSPGTAVIFSIAFGIAVDDTIHMLARLRQEMAAGLSLRDAIRTSILGTGKAVILTSLVLLGGFGALMTSRFEGTANLGALVSLTVVLALLADLLLLPALLHVMKPKLTRKT